MLHSIEILKMMCKLYYHLLSSKSCEATRRIRILLSVCTITSHSYDIQIVECKRLLKSIESSQVSWRDVCQPYLVGMNEADPRMYCTNTLARRKGEILRENHLSLIFNNYIWNFTVLRASRICFRKLCEGKSERETYQWTWVQKDVGVRKEKTWNQWTNCELNNLILRDLW